MMRKRGSFKPMRGVKMNWTTRSGLTSVTIGGVNVRTRSGGRGRASSRPTKREILADLWRVRPGTHYVRIFAIQDDPWDFQVDGSELTFDRVKRILEANGHGDTARMTRAFKTFVKRWNLVNDDGIPIPITVGGVKQAGLEMVTAITIEIVHALDIPKEPWDRAMTYKETGEPVRVQTSSTPLPPFDPNNPSLREPDLSVRDARLSATPPRKSAGAAFVFWLLFGLIGGHRYYLGRPVSGFLMTITIGGLGVWWLLDLFLLPGMVNKANADS